jgi:peptidoglycan/xylan/chitin deacetylase (PgdA/CDA1 family)
MRKLDRAGWEIGLHGSYNSFLDQEMLACEKKLLEDVLGHKVIGIRQHHLNLHGKETWQYQKNVGFKYDSSFGYKGKIGFKENKYQPFYPIDQSFMVIPLALMDGNVIDSQYVIDKSNEDRIWQKCLTVINEAQKNKAVLSVLWHTRFFADKDFPGCAKMYERIIIECQKRGAEFLTGENILKEYGGN